MKCCKHTFVLKSFMLMVYILNLLTSSRAKNCCLFFVCLLDILENILNVPSFFDLAKSELVRRRSHCIYGSLKGVGLKP